MILVLGASGQVASELKQYSCVRALGRPDLNLSDLNSVTETIVRLRPLAVINAAAYTAVDEAEGVPELAKLINGIAPQEIAQACEKLDIPLVHISTDYVFDGNSASPYMPKDERNPINVYGASKKLGEDAIVSSGCRYVILRTSWVFSRFEPNFVTTMLRLGRERDQISVVDDQIGGPTSAASIANCCIGIASRMILDPNINGIFHYTGAPQVTWFEFAQEIFKLTSANITITPISTTDFPVKALRPNYSVLDCRSTFEVFGISQRLWRDELSSVLVALGERDV